VKNKKHNTRLTISLCVIVKNEEEFIGACLDSARPFVDELVVVDTGSTDKTVEIAREHGARVEFFEWCDDFAAARNYAIEHATSDWILMLDADEQLEPESGPLLRPYADQLPSGALAYAVLIENKRRTGGAAEDLVRHTVTRFFPRRASLRYVGAIHEDLVDSSECKLTEVLTAGQVRVAHYGYDPELYAQRGKDARNTRLLEIVHAREPENERVLFYLGQQSFVGRRYADAARWLERFVESAHSTPGFWLPEAYQMWVEALVNLSDDNELARVAARAEQANALSGVAREVLARYELQRGHPGAALRHVMAALNPDVPSGITIPEGTGGWKTRLILARTYQELNEPESALKELDHIFGIAPALKHMEIATTAAEYALRMGMYDTALTWAVRATHVAHDVFDAHDLLLKLKLRVLRGRVTSNALNDPFAELDAAVAAEDWQASYDAAFTLPLGKMAALARVVHVAQQLRERGAPEAALALLGRTLDTHSPTQRVYWPLVQVLKDLERIDDALNALEVLRTLPAAA
jgi:tetratricopeptide (TPR) repeat protein